MLLQALEQADADRNAVGHFNVSEITALNAVAKVREDGRPVIVGLSEGERKFFGTRQAAAMIRSLRDEFGIDLFLNADHSRTLQSVESAARAGYDMVVFDASDRPFEENVAMTRQAVAAAKSLNPDILVEGEIGFIGSGSQLHDSPQSGLGILTSPEEARQYSAATGVDLLSPAVGNMHGLLPSMLTGESHKHLDISRISEIAKATGLFLTLHGGSGTADGDFVRAIDAGVRVIHVNTELRVAWRRGLEAALSRDQKEFVPYKLLAEASARAAEVVRNRSRLFSHVLLPS